MGGWIPVGICVVAAYLLYNETNSLFFWSVIIATIVCFWSFGIMHNFAAGSYYRRLSALHKIIYEKEIEAGEKDLIAKDNADIEVHKILTELLQI